MLGQAELLLYHHPGAGSIMGCFNCHADSLALKAHSGAQLPDNFLYMTVPHGCDSGDLPSAHH